jgi:hypothetical protein
MNKLDKFLILPLEPHAIFMEELGIPSPTSLIELRRILRSINVDNSSSKAQIKLLKSIINKVEGQITKSKKIKIKPKK